MMKFTCPNCFKERSPHNYLCMDCIREGENIDLKNHLNHPLYIDAQNFWNDVQRQQIIKGMEKYPEPLNPQSWTFEQLIEHAMQENVDQAHYLTALREKSREQDKRIRELDNLVETLERRNEELHKWQNDMMNFFKHPKMAEALKNVVIEAWDQIKELLNQNEAK
jgi:hypothetical protein